jgi:hypothetical protein
VSVGDVTSRLGEAGGESLEGFDMGDIDLEYSYAIEIEGNIIEYAPKEIATVDGSKVTWDLTSASTDTVELMLKWEPGGGLNPLLIVLIATALGGLILVAAGIFLTVRSKEN